jgi:hypothetical protein
MLPDALANVEVVASPVALTEEPMEAGTAVPATQPAVSAASRLPTPKFRGQLPRRKLPT